MKLARSIGIAVDHRRRNRSLESLQVPRRSDARLLVVCGTVSPDIGLPFGAARSSLSAVRKQGSGCTHNIAQLCLA